MLSRFTASSCMGIYKQTLENVFLNALKHIKRVLLIIVNVE